VIEVLFPTFTPDLSKARRISFTSKAELEEEESLCVRQVSYEYMVKLRDFRLKKQEFRKEMREWAKKRKQLYTNVFKSKRSLNRAHELMDLKRVRACRENLAYNIKRLEGWELEKPISPVFGDSSNRLLESVDVESKEKVSSAS
jgi:hypothetical protein